MNTAMKQIKSSPMLDKTERRIIHLHDNGWHVPNIAHIAHVPEGTVRKILLRQNIEPLM